MNDNRSIVLVTGASGFVGTVLCEALAARGYRVRAATRSPGPSVDGALIERVVVGEINGATDWSRVLPGVETIVHLAARAHVMRDRSIDPLAAYRTVNTQGTEQLARCAVEAGVSRFVYISTIKVNGESTHAEPFRETNQATPIDPYGISKWESERWLQRLSVDSGLETVIVRPPLVYGPRVKGNFLSLLHWVERGIPLPFECCDNRRSFVGLTNLVAFLIQCTIHPAAAGETFIVSDGEDLSTAELVRRVARALGRPARLLPLPSSWLRFSTRLVGREAIYERLCGSLQVDSGKARRVLGWTPPLSVDEELENTARWFLNSKS